MNLLSSADFFISTFKRNPEHNTIRESNSLDPDQDQQYVGPDLGPNCLQRLSRRPKTPLASTELKIIVHLKGDKEIKHKHCFFSSEQ